MNPTYMPRRGERFVKTYDADEWMRKLSELGVRPLTATKWSLAFADEVQPSRFSRGLEDLRMWLPQILHECSMLERLQENLNYSSTARIRAIWPSRFPTEMSALPYAKAPERLANKVYADRMGNGNEDSGDGWLFRGRGPIMLTGRAGYRHLGDILDQDLESLPQLLEQPRFGLEAAIYWWEDRIPDSMLSDQVKLRRRVNGGTIGLAHCQELADLACKVLA